MTTGPISSDQLAAQQAAAAAEAARQAAAAEAARQAAAQAADPAGAREVGPIAGDTNATQAGFGDVYGEGAGAAGDISADEYTALQLALDGTGGGAATGAGAVTAVVAAATQPATTPAGVVIPPPGTVATPDPNLALALEVGDVEAAKKAYEAAETELNQRLAAFGDALTPEQRQAFTDRFWNDPEHKAERADARDKYEAEKRDLAAFISANQGVIARQVLDAPDAARQDQLLKDLERAVGLAGDAGPGLAFGLGIAMLSAPEAAKNGLADRIAGGLIEPHMEARAAEHVAAAGGDGAAGMAAFAQELGFIGKRLDDVNAKTAQPAKWGTFFKDAAEGVQGLAKWFETAKKAPGGLAAEELARYIDGYKGSPAGKTIAFLGLVAGVGEAKSAAEQGQILDLIKASCSTGKDGIEFAGQFNRYSKVLGKGTFAADKLAPALGAVAAGISAAQKAGTLKDDHDQWLALSTVSDLMVLGGSLAIVAGSGVVGPALVAVGTAAAFAFDKLYGARVEERTKIESKRYLEAIGVAPPEYADLLARQPRGHLNNLARNGLTPGQMKQFYLDGFGPDLIDGRQGHALALGQKLGQLASGSKDGGMDLYGVLSQIEARAKTGDERQEMLGQLDMALDVIVGANPQVKDRPQPAAWWRQQFELLAAGTKPYHPQATHGAAYAQPMAAVVAGTYQVAALPR